MSTINDIIKCMEVKDSSRWWTVKALTKETKKNPETIARLLRKEKNTFTYTKSAGGRFEKGWKYIGNPSAGQFPLLLAVSPFTSVALKALDIVKSYAQRKAAFSAYDITIALREYAKLPTNTINPAETGVIYVKGKPVPNIVHDDIRTIVRDLFDKGEISNYIAKFNGTYIVYEPAK